MVEYGPRWSVIIPSHNGEDTLPACLDALARLSSPPGGFEVILVDNASTDGTATMMDGFAERHGAKCLTETRKGKSFALNTGIENAKGEMLVFLDDDVISVPELLCAYSEAEHEFRECGIFAGQIRPSWSSPAPDWLNALSEEGMCCGCTPAGMNAGQLDARYVKGGNMVFRRSALGLNRFSTEGVNFGASRRAIGGEDSELVRRVAAKTTIRYVPQASVRHVIAPDEMSWKGVFARYVRIGRGNAAQGLGARSFLGGVARMVVRAAMATIAFLSGDRTAAARQSVHLAMRIGALDYRFRRLKLYWRSNVRDLA